MSGIAKYKNLNVWKESFQLSVELYNILRDSKEYGIKDHIISSSLSIPLNIAEGG
jgi:four helix bundle protein